MPRGFFTQGAVLLLPERIDPSSVADAIGSAFECRLIKATEPPASWVRGHDVWTTPIPHTPRGVVEISYVDTPWPDSMGDPKADPTLFAAWSMGFLGPFTYPGNLDRAMCFAKLSGKGDVAVAARSHRSFVMLRATHARGAGPHDPVFPDGWSGELDLERVTDVAQGLGGAFDKSLYFNPAGETLHDARAVAEIRDGARTDGVRPLALWCNVRIFNLDQLAPGWRMMDTVGASQFASLQQACPDHEVCWNSRESIDTNEIWQFLLNMTDYTIERGPVIKTDHTADGAGTRWRAFESSESITAPTRSTLRWFKATESRVPTALTRSGGG